MLKTKVKHLILMQKNQKTEKTLPQRLYSFDVISRGFFFSRNEKHVGPVSDNTKFGNE